MQQFISLDNISFSYENSTEYLFNSISIKFHTGWTGIVGANGSGKTTLLRLINGDFIPDSGIISIPGTTYYSEQRTDTIPEEFPEFLKSIEKNDYKTKKALEIENEWSERWNSLSHGERKRCQIATALYKKPDVLAVDEPSNHLDESSKEILKNTLKLFSGIGILISHDRDLLDNLCKNTLFIFSDHLDLRRCNYSRAAEELEREHKFKEHEIGITRREIKKLKQKVEKQGKKAANADKERSKRKLKPKDHDAKSKKDLARMTGKDGMAGKAFAQLKDQLGRAEYKQKSIKFRKKSPMGISFNTSDMKRYFPLIIAPGELNLGEERSLQFPEMSIQNSDKIGIIGDNGSGKSTFVNHILKMINLPGDRQIYIPQEIPIQQSKSVNDRIQKLNRIEKGEIMTIISRLGSDPNHLLETEIPTPGEVRKLLLALGIIRHPALIIMDEPTNHMDLPSIQCVEGALKECRCAQILVSHDRIFLKNIVSEFWSFGKTRSNMYRVSKNN